MKLFFISITSFLCGGFVSYNMHYDVPYKQGYRDGIQYARELIKSELYRERRDKLIEQLPPQA